MKVYIKDKIGELIKNGKEPKYESLSIIDFIKEFDYATKYLSRLLKVRPFIMYLLLFKKVYFEEGKRIISIKLSDLGKNLLSDFGKPMSHDVVKRGINDLVRLKIIGKQLLKPGQINEYEVKLPSEMREVKDMIKREGFKCFYCLKELQIDDFYLDHLTPRSKGGQNYKSNLITSCKTCNTKKNAIEPEKFLLENYRNGLLTQEEYSVQKDKLTKVREENKRVTQ